MKRILAALAAIAIAACDNTTAPNGTGYEPLPADQVLVGVTHNMTVGGVRSAKLEADTSYMFNDSSTVTLVKVNLELFDEGGRPRAILTSTGGSLDQRTRRMIARGNVVLRVTGSQSMTVTTEELYYDPTEKRVWSNVRTTMRKPGSTLTGESFTSDDQFLNPQIRGGSGTGLSIPIGG